MTYFSFWTVTKIVKLQLVHSPNLCLPYPLEDNFMMLLLWRVLADLESCWDDCFLVSSTDFFLAHNKISPQPPLSCWMWAQVAVSVIGIRTILEFQKTGGKLPLWWLFTFNTLGDLFYFYPKPLASQYRYINESVLDKQFCQVHYNSHMLCVQLSEVLGYGNFAEHHLGNIQCCSHWADGPSKLSVVLKHLSSNF